MNPSKWLEHIQNRPEGQRKMILWGVTALVAIGGLIWLLYNLQNNIIRMQDEERQSIFGEGLREHLEDIPEIRLPSFPEFEEETLEDEEDADGGDVEGRENEPEEQTDEQEEELEES